MTDKVIDLMAVRAQKRNALVLGDMTEDEAAGYLHEGLEHGIARLVAMARQKEDSLERRAARKDIKEIVNILVGRANWRKKD